MSMLNFEFILPFLAKKKEGLLVKQINHMQNLRETHKQLSAELSELERWRRKCQVCMLNFHANSVKIFYLGIKINLLIA